jgi:hypothetical protein
MLRSDIVGFCKFIFPMLEEFNGMGMKSYSKEQLSIDRTQFIIQSKLLVSQIGIPSSFAAYVCDSNVSTKANKIRDLMDHYSWPALSQKALSFWVDEQLEFVESSESWHIETESTEFENYFRNLMREFAAVTIQSIYRMSKELKRYSYTKHCITSLQKRYKYKLQLRKNHQIFLREKAASKIQATFRGHRVRRVISNVKRDVEMYDHDLPEMEYDLENDYLEKFESTESDFLSNISDLPTRTKTQEKLPVLPIKHKNVIHVPKFENWPYVNEILNQMDIKSEPVSLPPLTKKPIEATEDKW